MSNNLPDNSQPKEQAQPQKQAEIEKPSTPSNKITPAGPGETTVRRFDGSEPEDVPGRVNF
jgi:hypothetical protein